jgi:hypothetical protein
LLSVFLVCEARAVGNAPIKVGCHRLAMMTCVESRILNASECTKAFCYRTHTLYGVGKMVSNAEDLCTLALHRDVPVQGFDLP